MRFASLLLVAAAIALSVSLYPRLPATMPTHFDLSGHVDGYSSRAVGAFFGPVMMIVIALMFSALPRISPRGYRFEGASRWYGAMKIGVLTLLFGVHLLVLLTALGWHPNVALIIPLASGALFVLLGNYLAKVPRNFFVGIRTPWTLASEDVWYRTHRVGGKTFVVAGVLMMVAAPLASQALFFGIVIAAALLPTVYSYIVYRREEHASIE